MEPRGAAAVLDRLFGVDTRSLALFRICLGSVLLADLVDRFSDRDLFYGARGVLPAADLDRLIDSSPWQWSVHAATDAEAGLLALWIVAMVAALALLLGLWTRMATAVSWLLLVSLQARNPLLLYGADQLLRMLLFWAMFLPLGCRASLDAGRTATSGSSRILSFATAALLLQPAWMYLFAGLLKGNEEWASGAAVEHALSFAMYAKPVARTALAHPGVLRVATYLVPSLELAAPLLLVLSGLSPIARTAVVAALVGFHAAIHLVLETGLFAPIASTALIPFLPGDLWERLGWRALPPSATSPARWRFGAALREAGALLALVYVVAWNVVGLDLDRYWTAHRLEWAQEQIEVRGAVPYLLRDRIVERMLGWLGLPGRVLALHQRWDMFYQVGPQRPAWHVIVGRGRDGERRSLLEGGRPIDDPRERGPSSVSGLYPSSRWRVYFTSLRAGGARRLQERFPPAMREAWNRRHPAQPIDEVEVFWVEESVSPGGTERTVHPW